MSLAVSLPPVVAASPYAQWRRHFLQNDDSARTLPWGDAVRLTAAERRTVGSSIQQFQLGEWARGRGFMRRAETHPLLGQDAEWLAALRLFIAEEQRHSTILGKFLDREGIPRLREHWLDGIFRKLRKLAGLEACTAVLVTAETLAIPFYQALRDATGSPLLRAICVRILCEEAAHLKFQALTIGLIRRSLNNRTRAAHAWWHTALFHGTALALWQQHHRVFHAANWSFWRFWRDARREFAILEQLIRQSCSADVASFAERLD